MSFKFQNSFHTVAVTPVVMAIFLLCFPEVWYLLWIFLPTHTGIPMIMAGIEMPAMSAIPTGAPTKVPSCHISFFFRLHGFLPQNVQPVIKNLISCLANKINSFLELTTWIF